MNSCTWTLSFSPFHPTPCHLLSLSSPLPSSPSVSSSIISQFTSPSTGFVSPLLCPVLSSLSSPVPFPPPPSMVVADSDFASKMKNRQMGSSGGINMTKSTSISGDMCNLEKTDGSQSDTAVGTVGTDDKKRRSSIGAKMQAMVGMSRKSRSTSQLSQTGRASSHTASVLPVFSVASVPWPLVVSVLTLLCLTLFLIPSTNSSISSFPSDFFFFFSARALSWRKYY